MKRYFCDKCGKEMTKEQYSTHFFTVSKHNVLKCDYHNELVLCEECERKLFEWLGVDEKQNVDN